MALAFIGGVVAGVFALFGAAVVADRVDQRRIARRIEAARKNNQLALEQLAEQRIRPVRRQPRIGIVPARDDFDMDGETR